METLTLMLDTAAVLAIVFYSLRNEKLPPGAPEQGPFRIKPQLAEPVATPTGRLARRRIRGL